MNLCLRETLEPWNRDASDIMESNNEDWIFVFKKKLLKILLLMRKFLPFHRWLILWGKINLLGSAETLDNSLHWVTAQIWPYTQNEECFASLTWNTPTHSGTQHDHRFHFCKNIQRRSFQLNPLQILISKLVFYWQIHSIKFWIWVNTLSTRL